MPYDPNDEETKAALAEQVKAATEKLEAKVRELIGEKRRAGEGKVDAAELERIEAERDKLVADLATAQRDLSKANKAAEAAAKALEAEQGHTAKLLISDGLNAALRDAGVTDPKLMKAAAAMLRDDLKPGVVIEGDARVAKAGDKLLAEAVKAWAQSDEGKTFVSAPNNSGGGARGADGGGGQPVGNLAGSPNERTAALKARFPELAQTT